MTRSETSVNDRLIETAILTLLNERGADKTICPSEAARGIARERDDVSWREWMPAVREAAARLVADGRLRVTQRGEPVELLSARGPIRLALLPRDTH